MGIVHVIVPDGNEKWYISLSSRCRQLTFMTIDRTFNFILLSIPIQIFYNLGAIQLKYFLVISGRDRDRHCDLQFCYFLLTMTFRHV